MPDTIYADHLRKQTVRDIADLPIQITYAINGRTFECGFNTPEFAKKWITHAILARGGKVKHVRMR